MTAIVKYHNDIHTVSLRKFNATELDIFMAIISRMCDKDVTEVVFPFDDIKDLIAWRSKDDERFLSLLRSTYDKLLQCNISIGNNKNWTSFVLFTKYAVSSDDREVTIAVNKEFQYTLNLLLSNFTRFELSEFISLNSSYAKEFYRRMKQFRTTGFWEVSLEEFKRVMDIPEGYTIDAIDNRVLAPIFKELGVKYGLEVKKIYEKKRRGRPPVCGLKFSFLKEDRRGGDPKAIALPSGPEGAPPKKGSAPQRAAGEPKRDMEFDEGRYSKRAIRVRDKKLDRYNCLKVKSVVHDPESGKVSVTFLNMDDGYENTVDFDRIRLWDNYFKKYLI